MEEMVRIAIRTNPGKLREVGKRYDQAHAKVGATEVQNACTGVRSIINQLSTTPSELGSDLAGYNSKPTSETESSVDSNSEAESNTGLSERQQWNAVCIVGLRVIAQHAGISITDSGDL
jgi:hypothetical protein